MRIGFGYDLHRLVEGRKLILGGVQIPYEKGLLGHSDADVLCHAISEALLGAAALGNIGQHFPDTDPEYKDANSLELLQTVFRLVRQENYQLVNIDTTILAQAPKIMPYADQIIDSLATALDVHPNQISVKATTNEGLDAVGRGEAIAAHAVVLLDVLEV